MQQLLVIGTVWPEPNSTAAGQYMMTLLSYFKQQGYRITFASSAAPSAHSIDLSALGIDCQAIQLNCSSFDDFVADLRPDIVLFDRFMIEEQYGWRVQKYCPDAVRILDLEDLHGLRQARHQAHKAGRTVAAKDYLNDTCLREIAAIWRSDLALVISTAELKILQDVFAVPAEKCCYLPFVCSRHRIAQIEQQPSYEVREHFVTIGHFRHAPNWDSVLFLKQQIWPKIRKQLPSAELHVYGAYPSKKVVQLDCIKTGFRIKGWAEDAYQVIRQARLMLAPLRFGAGLKGKLFDASCTNTPFVTTDIGAEGLLQQGYIEYSQQVANDASEFATKAVRLYQDEVLWRQVQNSQFKNLVENFDQAEHQQRLTETLQQLKQNLVDHRLKNFTGAMLMHHTMKSTQYMAQWIEAKNRSL
ncbi:glycosyltransferase [Gayadomonas joobiniege]|uniref:glycosyltransferase n=1 Tax=Gayadomonas joobiniege TaxID=1234606 RepID=UPI00037AACE7|nr:glycosyltransferase [Gayadomonas joobiniege]